MSALTQDWAPGITPGARAFANSIEDIEMVGGSFAPEQVDLLERASVFRPHGWWNRLYVLAAVAVPDPLVPYSGYSSYPALTLDEFGTKAPVFIPAVAEVDCSEWETFDESEPNWRRFPSVLARMHVYSAYTGTLLEGLDPVRLAHCWPLDEQDVPMVQEAARSFLHRDGDWGQWREFVSVSENDDEQACDMTGCPSAGHTHEIDDMGYVTHCMEGEAWYEHYKNTELDLDRNGNVFHKPFRPIGGLHHLTETWERLLGTTRVNSLASLACYPSWEQEDVVYTERHYSPWLWSC